MARRLLSFVRDPPTAALGRLLVLASSLVLFGSLFLPWYDVIVIEIADGPDRYVSAWDAFRYADALLAAIALAGAAVVAVERFVRARGPYLALALAAWLAVAVIVTGYFWPALGRLGSPPEARPSIGFFAALCAAGAMMLGSVWASLAEGRANAHDPPRRATGAGGERSGE